MTQTIPVLVVDDSQLMQTSMRSLLESTGRFSVAGTAAGEMGVISWLEANPDNWRLAIVDLLLADGSGFAVVRRCRIRNPAATIVVVSEYASPAVSTKCIALGADAVFLRSDLDGLSRFLGGLPQ